MCGCPHMFMEAWQHARVCVCMCVCLCSSDFVWCDTAASDCPVFPFPLWLITRAPVNPRYHQRIKRRPPSPRDPISSESRTQTGKLLDLFAGQGTVQISGLKDAPWHHPAAGRSPLRIKHTQVHKRRNSLRYKNDGLVSFRQKGGKRKCCTSSQSEKGGRRSEIEITL